MFHIFSFSGFYGSFCSYFKNFYKPIFQTGFSLTESFWGVDFNQLSYAVTSTLANRK